MSKGPFSEKNIKNARDRIPSTSTKRLREWRERAKSADSAGHLMDFIAAIDDELEARPIDVDGDAAEANATWAREAAGMTLADAVRYGFGQARPPSSKERLLLKILAEHPGISAEECTRLFNNEGMGLYLGHLVYERYGCFRHLLPGHKDQSSVLVRKEKIAGRQHYWLRPEVKAALEELDVV
ncbi:hypothetical protein H0I76_18580 [Limibaculum sp. M0105]|uniref:Uncharacterized protein n=1 Tax=Thermohalobaculum xanthum TaxID=2753746 RepID=A0A8J7SJU8_9RHOB|nr:hypothetical protein [Thermohalobaculum xanthum]MBK0401210.1 hypothetical protein [Thermohalobaculum xanthum]